MNWVAAAVIAALLCVAAGMVMLGWTSLPRRTQHGAQRLARLTLRQARRTVILVVGVTLLVVGVIMIVAPGPAVVVIPLGLAVLATEFVWARRLLVRYKRHADTLAKRVGGSVWLPRPWMVVLMIAATILGAVAVLFVTNWPRHWIVSVTTSLLIMEALTMYLVISGARTPLPDNNPQDTEPTQP